MCTQFHLSLYGEDTTIHLPYADAPDSIADRPHNNSVRLIILILWSVLKPSSAALLLFSDCLLEGTIFDEPAMYECVSTY